MAEEKPGDAVLLGKKFAGEKFPTVRTPEASNDEQLLQYASDPQAIPIEAYFVSIRANSYVKQQMMLAYTKIRKAPRAVFDKIFETF